MRFAGDDIASYLKNDNRPNFGKLSQQADTMRTDEANAYTGLDARVGAQGISTAAAVEGNKLMADARGKVAEAQGDAQMMSSLGSIGSSLIGAFTPSSSGAGTGSGLSGYSYSDFAGSMNANPFAR